MPAHRGRVSFGRKDVNAATRLLLVLPALALAGLFLFLLRGGGGGDAGVPRLADPGGGWPRVIVPPGAEELVLERPPERVLLANASAVDMLVDLVGPERAAALPRQAFDYSVLAYDPELAETWADVPTFVAFEAEVVLKHDPDLVVVDPWADQATVARLRELGLAVLPLPRVTALDDVRASLAVLGHALGADERAEAVLADVDARVARLRAEAPRRAGLTAASYTNSGAGGWSAGAGTTNHELITLAGLTNATAERGRRDHVRTSFEDLYAMDPDFLVVGDYRDADDPGATARFLRSEAALADLRAVREGRILAVPAPLFSASSHRIVRGAEVLADRVDGWLAEHGGRASRGGAAAEAIEVGRR